MTAFGYPGELAQLVVVPVENFGFDGIDTGQAIALLPKISARDPQVVVIEIGGHDYNQGRTRNKTSHNLERLVVACKDMGARVILVEIPRGFINDPFSGIERAIAGQHDLQLLSDDTIRQFVLWSPICPPGMWIDSSKHYSRDGLHPNSLGNRFFAKQVARAISRIMGPDVLR